MLAALIEDTEFEWTDEDLGKLANQNLIRTLRSVEVSLIMSAKHHTESVNVDIMT